MKVPFSYLDRQFADLDPFLNDLKEFVKTGDFTLGAPLKKFEKSIATLLDAPFALGVGTGTDALVISLKMLGIGAGDEVITTPMTFVATVGAIVQAGATPVFVDSEEGFVIDPTKIEAAITPKTKAIMPVHYTGNVADMPAICAIAKKHNLHVIEDGCQAFLGSIDGKPIGSFGKTVCLSFHPLKNLNVWSDAGMIITHDEALAKKIALYRNHGLINRDEVLSYGINSRMDSIQAVIGNRMIPHVEAITKRRIEIAHYYDETLSQIEEIAVPKRRPGVRHVFHLYMVRTQKRDELLAYLHEKGIEAKVHYPIPMHLQEASRYLGYQEGDFPVCENDCKQIITLPAHPYLTDAEVEYTTECIASFFAKSPSVIH